MVAAANDGDRAGGGVESGREGVGNRRCGREEERDRVSGLDGEGKRVRKHTLYSSPSYRADSCIIGLIHAR